jgi:hypothetical protein
MCLNFGKLARHLLFDQDFRNHDNSSEITLSSIVLTLRTTSILLCLIPDLILTLASSLNLELCLRFRDLKLAVVLDCGTHGFVNKGWIV